MYALLIFTAVSTFFKGSKLFTALLIFLFAILYLMYSSGRIGGVDTPFYRNVFSNEARCAIFEYGFYQLCRFDSPTGFSFTFFLSSFSLIIALYRVANGHRDLAIMFLILFPTYFIIMDLGYVRQAMSVSILLLFCFNQENRKIRLVGYALAPFFHVASIVLIFFFELIYSSRRGNFFILMTGVLMTFVAISLLNKFISGGIISLLTKGFSFASIIQLIFLLILAQIASFQFKWKTSVRIFVFFVTLIGYFGHFYRVYLFLLPVIIIGVASYFSQRSIAYRYLSFLVFSIFGFIKLQSTVFESDGLFDIPYSENSIAWFL